ncbi:uncharacterized protein VTP21DRAFT_7021 [Calcarisporiella thermophila]|uniref:uncharacterized protein n=1 Tax=Calcarisporiella thermophila TaxID=911321 RepID=UPI0037442361
MELITATLPTPRDPDTPPHKPPFARNTELVIIQVIYYAISKYSSSDVNYKLVLGGWSSLVVSSPRCHRDGAGSNPVTPTAQKNMFLDSLLILCLTCRVYALYQYYPSFPVWFTTTALSVLESKL